MDARHGRTPRWSSTGGASRASPTGVYPRQDRFLYAYNDRNRKEMGKALLG